MSSVARPVRANRLLALPPYLFIAVDRQKRAKRAAGVDVIDLGVGDPDRPTPSFIIDAMSEAIRRPANHRYPSDPGAPAFRAAAAEFMQRRFNVKADPDRHIMMCIGSKEGIAHLPLAVVNPGDRVLMGEIMYPPYRAGALFAGAEVVTAPMTEETGWCPDFQSLDSSRTAGARLAWVNFPNNPTAAVAPPHYVDDLVSWCADRDIILASDCAYSEVYFDEHDRPRSMWASPGADLDRFLGIEFHSLSKTYNMTGWRIGFAVGHPEVVRALADLKGNCDSGQFTAIQEAAALALGQTDSDAARQVRETYRERRDVLCAGLQSIGCAVTPPRATFFVWSPCPEAMPDSEIFCRRCLDEAGVVLIPGAGFSERARGYFRAGLVAPVERLEEAVDRLRRIAWR